ncbi:MAG: biotin--[acetyl-CoA-carboxylase] ligase [bacterium]|nr:biotin--[acetyl-CoA-carboxylase] ligase [bacterium]
MSPRLVRYFPVIDSTNQAALHWLAAADGAPDRALIIADEQTSGRGRSGRTWFALAGTSVLITLILHPSRAALPRITMLGALALLETVRAYGAADAGIKWANDVQIGGRKVCGVLPEAAWQGDQLLGVALGIGLNVNVDFAGSPLDSTATSLQAAAGRPLDRLEVLQHMLERLDHWLERIDDAALFETWRGALNMIGRPVSAGGISGTAEAVEADGALIVRTADGVRHRVIAGDIGVGYEEKRG